MRKIMILLKSIDLLLYFLLVKMVINLVEHLGVL